jgi:hypothetical protein
MASSGRIPHITTVPAEAPDEPRKPGKIPEKIRVPVISIAPKIISKAVWKVLMI